jgi:hypothetical protein
VQDPTGCPLDQEETGGHPAGPHPQTRPSVLYPRYRVRCPLDQEETGGHPAGPHHQTRPSVPYPRYRVKCPLDQEETGGHPAGPHHQTRPSVPYPRYRVSCPLDQEETGGHPAGPHHQTKPSVLYPRYRVRCPQYQEETAGVTAGPHPSNKTFRPIPLKIKTFLDPEMATSKINVIWAQEIEILMHTPSSGPQNGFAPNFMYMNFPNFHLRAQKRIDFQCPPPPNGPCNGFTAINGREQYENYLLPPTAPPPPPRYKVICAENFRNQQRYVKHKIRLQYINVTVKMRFCVCS